MNVFPAHAGMIPILKISVVNPKCVPRACGDDPGAVLYYFSDELVFPAHAGMIPARAVSRVVRICVPRACGDDPLALAARLPRPLCSPRMRG